MINIITKKNALLDVDLILEKAGIKDKMVVADFGCGTSGRYVFGACRFVGKNGTVYAVDILKTNLESVFRKAKTENLINIKTIWSNLEILNATNIESGSVDVGLLITTLYQSNKKAEIIREVIRIIRKHGKLIIVEWKSIFTPFGPPLENRVSEENIKNIAGRLGLKLEAEFFVGLYHYGLIFIKL